ncbi:glycosyltransferase [Halomonas hibernica]|uniref:glycosyltransferase n=1 Tax=Halomonas hibernica TaxID=2591147 RepID=UPI0015545B2B|nr:glycosyltransferase family 2 protein [Halomonas hibernica]
MKKIAICVATCNRNEMLARCIDSVINASLSVTTYEFFLIVVDNNTKPKAQQVCDKFKELIDLNYYWEAQPGIPFARNRCLFEALENKADFIAFIDDDEEVKVNWLEIMLQEIDREGVDVVSGQVMQVYNERVELKRNLPDGSIRDRCETDNVVFKSWLAESLKFDESMPLTGGTDVLFFRQAKEKGAVIRYCDKSIAKEDMSGFRQSLRWRLQRQYRYGLTHCLIEKKLMTGASSFKLFLRAIILIPLGLVEALFYLPCFGFQRALAGVDRTMRGVGSLSYFLGFNYNEYKRKN